MIIRFTKKAADKIKVNTEKHDSNAELFDEWYVNLFIHEKQKYFIVTEACSLLTSIFPVTGINTYSKFAEKVNEEIALLSGRYGITKKINFDDAVFAATNSRPILGSMNLFITYAGTYDLTENTDIEKILWIINSTPLTYLGNKSPEKKLKDYGMGKEGGEDDKSVV